MNSGRERILGRLRAPKSSQQLPQTCDEELFANYSASLSRPVEAFAAKLAGLKGEFHQVTDIDSAASKLKSILAEVFEHGAKSGNFAIRQKHGLLEQICNKDSWLQSVVKVATGEIENSRLGEFEVGITTADFLIARTGSILVSAASSGGRRLSVLPPFHIVIATQDQIVSSLDEAFDKYRRDGKLGASSYAAIITGPSRTADIEKILVLGAHGPKRLAVILMAS